MQTYSLATRGQNRVVSTRKNSVIHDQCAALALVNKAPTAWEVAIAEMKVA